MFAGTSSNPSLVQNLYQNRCLTHVTSPCGEKSCCCLKSHKSQWIFLDSQLVYHDISYHSSPVDQKNRLFQPTYPIETVVHSSKFLFNLILSIRFFVFVKVNLAIINQGYIPFNHHFAWWNLHFSGWKHVKTIFFWVKSACWTHFSLSRAPGAPPRFRFARRARRASQGSGGSIGAAVPATLVAQHGQGDRGKRP